MTARKSRKRYGQTFPVLIMGIVAAGCSEQPQVPDTVRPVKTMAVPAPALERTLVYSGTLAPRVETSLGFRVAGKIVERPVNVGDSVKKGQAVARLDDTDLKLSENTARANLAAAMTRAAVARDALNRANALLPNGYIARSVVDQRQLDNDSAAAAVDSARDQLNQAINATGYAPLVADRDGTVTSVKAETGQVVSVGQAVITLAHAGDIEVAASVPEQEIVRLHPGDVAAVTLYGVLNSAHSGKIREIAGSADPASRTYPVRVAIADPSPAMRLGMTATVTFKVAQPFPAVVLPLSAFTERDGKTLAYVADPVSETVKRREVEIDGVTDDGAKVKSGLNPGEIVVTGGAQFLTDGMKVRVPREAGPAVAGTVALRR